MTITTARMLGLQGQMDRGGGGKKGFCLTDCACSDDRRKKGEKGARFRITVRDAQEKKIIFGLQRQGKEDNSIRCNHP